ncbi:MAG: FtsQ-type POTRA domain-containing protein [Clostridia bacterium]|nr:FtsQ-type POTRA domain-containing protein [Clostridia bacterium]
MNGGKGPGFDFEDGKIIRREDTEEEDELTVSEQTRSALMMQSYRETRARKTARKRTIAFCMIAFTVVVLIAVALFVFFRISDVTVTGSSRFTEEELKSSLKLSSYSNLILTGKSTLESRMRSAYPSLDQITIEKELPDKLIITVTDGVGKYYMRMGGDIYVITDELKIIEQTDKIPEGCAELISCDIVSAVTGQIITFRTGTHYNYLVRLLDTIEEHGISPHITCVDMSEKFNVKLRYDDRFIIVIGDAQDAKTKLELAEAVISTLSADEKGIIDASDIEKSSFRHTEIAD